MANDTDTDVEAPAEPEAPPDQPIPSAPVPPDILSTTRQMPTLGQTAAPAQAAPAQPGAAQQGPYAGILAGLQSVLSGGLGTAPTQPVGQQVQARHGGLVSGLVGVLLDGLAGGMAPDARTASEMPLIRQQQQMQMENLKLQQQKMQEEMALEPLRVKAMQAQTLVDVMQATHMIRGLSDQLQLGFSDAQMKSNDAAIEDGRAVEVAKGDYKSVMGQYQQVTGANKDTALHYGVDVVGRDPQTGDATQYRLFKYYPANTTQQDEVIDLPGDKSLGIDPIHEVIKAGTREDDRRAREAHLAAQQANQIKLQDERIEQQRLKLEQEKVAVYMTPVQTQSLEKIDAAYADPAHGYTQFLSQAQVTKSNISAAKDGSQLASSLVPMMTVLGVSSFAGIHRVSEPEIRAAGAHVGSLYRQLDALLDKVGTGSVPKETLDEANRLVDAMMDAKYAAVTQGARMYAANAGLDPTRIMVMDRTGQNVITLDNATKKLGVQGQIAGTIRSKVDGKLHYTDVTHTKDLGPAE